MACLGCASNDAFSKCPVSLGTKALLGYEHLQGELWFGSESLAVTLPLNGEWTGMGSNYNFRNKLFWWSKGFEPGSEKHLVVVGQRLDGKSPLAVVSAPSSAYSESLDGWTMLVTVEFPSPGC